MAGALYLGNQAVSPVIVKGGEYVGRELTEDGKYQKPESLTDFVLPADIKDVGDGALSSCIANMQYTSVNLNKLKKVTGDNAFSRFNDNNPENLIVDFGDLEEVTGEKCFNYAFENNSKLKTALLRNLKKVTGYQAFDYCFRSCPNLEYVDISSIEEIGSNGLYGFLTNCEKVTNIDISKLKKITSASLSAAFNGCKIPYLEFLALTDLTNGWWSFDTICRDAKAFYFLAVTPESFSQEHTGVFASMLSGTLDATVFFPSSVESVIGNWSDILSGCGGTNATILFYTPTKIKVTGIGGLSLKTNGYPYKKDYVVVATQTANFLVVNEDENKNVLCIETNCEEGEERVVNINVDSYSYKKITINDPLQATGRKLSWNGIELDLQEESSGVYYTYINSIVGETLTYQNDGTTEYRAVEQTFLTTGNDLTLTITPEPRQEREFTRPNLTSNGTLGGDSFAVYATEGNSTAYQAVDSSTSTYWQSNYYGSPSYTIYNPYLLSVSRFVFTWYSSSYRATKIVVYASNDNENWENLGEFNTTSSSSYTLNLTDVDFYRYYKFAFTRSGTYVEIKNITITATEKY